MRYWRDKTKNEIDFIYLKNRNSSPIAIECKWSAKNFNGKAINKFRTRYLKGENYVVAYDVDKPFVKTVGDVKVKFVNLGTLIAELT